MTRRKHSARYLLSALTGATLFTVGCSAELRSEGDAGQANETGSPAMNGQDLAPSNWKPGEVGGDPKAVSSLPLRMITSAQYERTIELVFEDYEVELSGLNSTAILPGEAADASGFATVGAITEVAVLRYMDAAREIAEAALPSASSWVGCELQDDGDEEACIRSFVSDFGRLLYRRPLTPETVQLHLDFYQKERQELGKDPLGALGQLLESMLNSPLFLYRWEQGESLPEAVEGRIRLSPFQIASRLAFYLWGSGPDRALLDAAAAGGLDTDEDVAAQARSMLESERATDALNSFHSQWLHLEKLEGLFKDPARFPQWNAGLSHSMQDEIRAFTSHVILQEDGLLETLLTAPYSYLNEELAEVYGVEGVTGDELRQVELVGTVRGGLLTMPGLLAAASEPSVENPFKRGKLMVERVLCQKLEPPPNVPPLPPPDFENPRPVRETLEEMTEVTPCLSCHSRLNPLGFGFGHFDAIGQFQSEDDLGFPVDASGVMPDGTAFEDAKELGLALAQSTDVRGCMTKQWFRFATSVAETAADDYSLEQAYAKFEETDFNLRELLVSLVSTPSFLYRAQDEGEVIQ